MQLGGERRVHDQITARDRCLGEARALAGEALVDAVEVAFRRLVDVDAGEEIGVAVAGRAVHRPVRGQVLVLRQDLLHHDPRAHERLVQALEVFARIGEAVRVVDAQPIDAAALCQAADQRMRRLEHRAVLDAHAGEVRDLEEAPVVDLVGGHAPVGEPIVLLLEQAVQRERVFHRARLERARALRVERKAVIEVAHAPAAALVLELELARFQRFAVVLAQHRQQQLAARPVDVEVARVGRCPALFQHVEPPRVVRVQHAHVVRHEVGHETHAVLAQRFDQLAQLRFGADLRIDRVVVDEVIAVHAARPRFQERRRVQVADAQAREVGNQPNGIRETEALVELQPVGGIGHALGDAAGDAALGHHLRRRCHARIARPAFERERQLPAPVRMLGYRSRQVGLLQYFEHVLGLHRGDLAWRARDVEMRRARRAVEAFARQRALQLGELAAP